MLRRITQVMNPNTVLLRILFVIFSLSVFAPWTGHPFDMQVWFRTGELLTKGENVYDPQDHYGYLPFWSYWAGFSFYVYLLLGAQFHLWAFLIKLPQVLALAAMAYLVTIKMRTTGGQTSFRLQLPFWVYASYVTAIWGQLNALSGLFVLLGVHLLSARRLPGTMASLGAGVAVKLYPVVALPFFLAQIRSKTSRMKTLGYLVLFLAIPSLVTFVTFAVFHWDWRPLLQTLLYQPFSILCEGCPGPRPLMNFWSLVWLIDRRLVANLASQLIWLPLWLYISFRSRSNQSSSWIIALYFAYLALFPRVSEPSLLDFIPLLLTVRNQADHSRVAKIGLVALPLIALLFTHLNFGILNFSPILGQELTIGVDASYRAQERFTLVIMGFLGSAVTLLSLSCAIELSRPASLSGS